MPPPAVRRRLLRTTKTLPGGDARGESTITSLDWASYRTTHFSDIPNIVIHLIDRPAEKPWGAGEPTAAVVPSAIANADYDATGVRFRSVPFTPERVAAAFRKA